MKHISPRPARGSVKIAAKGEEEKLQKFAEWCKKGTEYARVENVEMKRGEAIVEFKSFNIL
ncbi:MAG: hypothetical protein A3C07_04370 [Candidatus Sungbacteria bacterium RIFCSPHIGHO2_02_FULL_47_11]|uniref:Acylphosphatase-like domain-containing protein n=1 Tax=Candidatus Sungbacteria bacterium RIFCSPHIGHO2_02_FULL_47_11 TaxID=1802270 RepID=A0A1G2KMI9_9BACT|nr:MAG: hypothetical protein A3C07_04370 [Candidatus Sungbacteria bacterium RIFCSPHIGHO2_02_FULL_47_11]